MSCLVRRSMVSLSSVVVVVISLLIATTEGWSPASHGNLPTQSRNDFVRTLIQGGMATTILTTTTTVATLAIPRVSLAATTPTEIAALQEELKDSRTKLQEIPNLLQAQEWDKVRSILKTPPVNKLWNLGDSQNTVLKLAKETGDVELFELKDELAYNLQMCDQLTYDNVFVYFQPGSGKIKIKEPTDSANKAMNYLDQILDATK
mmetsp:Transcript_107798/g.310464  ORF Transcript_107798/g.310464 Transcript_107798/m.310464 type:complete len:205 (-) Transcript_107798:16-630(-)